MGKFKKGQLVFATALGICLLSACSRRETDTDRADIVGPIKLQSTDYESETGLSQETAATGTQVDSVEKKNISETGENREEVSFLDPEGKTLLSRIRPPEGYARISAEEDSLTEFLRNYGVKEDGSPVLLYDGSPKGNQQAHVAVLTLPIEERDLQQCADSIMRMYGEYFFATEQYDRIGFHFVNGFAAEYAKWREGYRISVEGNQVSWVKSGEYDDSYEIFVKYMRMVFAYAGTLSMAGESAEIAPEEIQAGDVFLKGGSPGHVVMVADICENEKGEKAFLLAQGYMPAQEFHILKNPAHEKDPWYYQDEIAYPFRTPEYTFYEGSLRRLQY